MRQILLKTLRARLTEELKSLPFEITSYGQVVAMVFKKGLNNSIAKSKGLNNIPENAKNTKSKQTEINDRCEQVAEKAIQKKRFKQSKATNPTGGSFFNPQPKKRDK